MDVVVIGERTPEQDLGVRRSLALPGEGRVTELDQEVLGEIWGGHWWPLFRIRL